MTTNAKIDSRLITAGMHITVPGLVRLWADHMPAQRPVPLRCPTCKHRWTERQPLCPTAAAVRPLLRRRRFETGPQVLDPLTTHQVDDLLGSRLSTALPVEEPT